MVRPDGEMPFEFQDAPKYSMQFWTFLISMIAITLALVLYLVDLLKSFFVEWKQKKEAANRAAAAAAAATERESKT